MATWLLAEDGQTVFMGGLIQDTISKTRETVPCLGSMPIFGALFGRSVETGSKTELVVLITPHIITGESQESGHYKRRVEEIEKEIRVGGKASAADALEMLMPEDLSRK